MLYFHVRVKKRKVSMHTVVGLFAIYWPEYGSSKKIKCFCLL